MILHFRQLLLLLAVYGQINFGIKCLRSYKTRNHKNTGPKVLSQPTTLFVVHLTMHWACPIPWVVVPTFFLQTRILKIGTVYGSLILSGQVYNNCAVIEMHQWRRTQGFKTSLIKLIVVRCVIVFTTPALKAKNEILKLLNWY